MKWPRHLITRPRRVGQPKPSGRCVHVGCIGLNWYRVDGGLVRQCCECGTVTTVIPNVVGGIATTCSTDNRPAEDWPGCTD